MPIALMFPFAEAAGITLTGLGIAKATDIIMNYIQANPEKSKQILSTLMPTIGGIGSMLMKEKSEGTSGEEQPTKQKDTRSKKEIVLDAVREGKRGRGNYSSPDATGPAVSIRGNVIRGLEEAGEVSKERKTSEEMEKEKKTKEPFDYKKFYKADGGRIGYQVGGVATPEQYAAALQKVGAGTETQKRTSLGNYLGDYIATQGQKLGNAAVIPFQAAKGILGLQGTPMTQSMQTSLQDIIQNQIKNTGKLSGDINYKDYGVQTSTGNEFLGFGGCNQMNGKVFYERGLLRFTNISTTRMMCAPNNKEADFLEALQNTTNYHFESRHLILSNPSGEKLVFKKVD